MSVVGNVHTAVVYESKGKNKTVPFQNQRLVVTIAKADKHGNYGQHLQQTMATSIPILTDEHLIDSLSDDSLQVRIVPHLVKYLESVQNSIIGDRIRDGKKTVHDSDLDVNAICQYLESEQVGDKWTSERIAAWFTDNLAESIGVALIEKGFSDDKMEASLRAYEKLFADTFSSKGVIARVKAVAIDKALKLAPLEMRENDSVYQRFAKRIEKTLEEVNLSEELGL